MCGRYTLRQSPHQIAIRFGVEETLLPELPPRYNIAPTQPVVAVTENSPRHLRLFQWGLVPFWAKDPSIGSRMINARAETLAEKPAFKNALTRRRCVIPADGFYEWKKIGSSKQPMYIRRHDGELFGFAGLWEEWISPDGSPLQTCTIITVAPNALMAPIHDRMPAILRPEDEAAWLTLSKKDVPELLGLLRPYPETEMEAYPVSRQVNAPTVDNAVCVQPLAEA